VVPKRILVANNRPLIQHALINDELINDELIDDCRLLR
jgi:hypothetical protein